MNERLSISERIARVKAKLPIHDVIGRDVVLRGGGQKRRGKCPFHGSKSTSFSVETGGNRPENGFAHCFGCAWHGDVIGYVRDMRGLSFLDALAACEGEAGLAEGEQAVRTGGGMVRREKASEPQRERKFVSSLDMARAIWRMARTDHEKVARYFSGRGVPQALLSEARLSGFRYLADCPCMAWPENEGVEGARPRSVMIAPAIMVMMRRPVWLDGETGGRLEFVPSGLHVTYLDPDGSGTMVRRKPWAKPDDEDPHLPKRRMLGEASGACVLLGDYRPDARLFIGEGNETVLSAMALAGAEEADVGVATLSLGNLQGEPRLRHGPKGRIWPLHAIEPSTERPPFDIPGHRGPVVGLIDSDMAPLKGMKDQQTGTFPGENVIERKGGPIVRRAITGAERAQICADLFVKGWRARGASWVTAMRAPLGMDFNDVARAEQAKAEGAKV
jgi:DNA primase